MRTETLPAPYLLSPGPPRARTPLQTVRRLLQHPPWSRELNSHRPGQGGRPPPQHPHARGVLRRGHPHGGGGGGVDRGSPDRAGLVCQVEHCSERPVRRPRNKEGPPHGPGRQSPVRGDEAGRTEHPGTLNALSRALGAEHETTRTRASSRAPRPTDCGPPTNAGAHACRRPVPVCQHLGRTGSRSGGPRHPALRPPQNREPARSRLNTLQLSTTTS